MLFCLNFVKTGAEDTAYIGDGDEGIRVYLMHDTKDE